jgi:ribosomal protein L10
VIVEGAKTDAKTVIQVASVALSTALVFELESRFASPVKMMIVAGMASIEVFGLLRCLLQRREAASLPS